MLNPGQAREPDPRRMNMTAAAAPAPSSLATGLVNADKSYAYKVILFAIATLADQRDSDTESHLIRVQHTPVCWHSS